MAYGPTLKTTQTRKPRWEWLLVGAVVLVILGVGGYYGWRWWQNSRAEDPVSNQEQQSSTQDEEVGVSDNQSPEPSASQSPVSSVPVQEQQAAAGLTVTSPSAGSTLKSGTKLEGSAPAGYTKVSYRIQSESRGVVGQGSLNVVSGAFSGTISSGGATGTGYIEVFVIGTDGNEAMHTKVNVNIGG